MNARPEEGEFNPYYGKYIALVPEGDIVETLRRQIGETVQLLKSISESRAGFRYAEGKWSIKELLGHLSDAERIFIYRALCVARGDTQSLPGFAEDEYVKASSFDSLPFTRIAAEFETVRAATLSFLENLSTEAWTRRGNANGSDVTVRAIAYILAGHELHHRQVLKDRYLSIS
jgi:uncharacterized damage-inducible protein DinB